MNLARNAMIATVMLVVVLLGIPSAAEAATGGRCTTTSYHPETRLQAFSGHTVRVRNQVCLRVYGPGRVQYTGSPVVSFTTTYPGGGLFESLALASEPTIVKNTSLEVAYEFTVEQTVKAFKFGMTSQTFQFRVRYKESGHQLCMTGHSDWSCTTTTPY